MYRRTMKCLPETPSFNQEGQECRGRLHHQRYQDQKRFLCLWGFLKKGRRSLPMFGLMPHCGRITSRVSGGYWKPWKRDWPKMPFPTSATVCPAKQAMLNVSPTSGRPIRSTADLAHYPTEALPANGHRDVMLLSIYCIEVRQAPLLAGLALGMSLNTKVLPLILIPMTLLYLKNFQQRFVFSAAAAGVVFVG